VTIPGTSRRGVSLLAIDATGNELVVIIENGKLRRLYSIDIPQNFPEFNRVGQVLSWNHEIDEYSLAAKTLAELCRRSAERVNASNDKEDGT
jgi:hypothetical protein